MRTNKILTSVIYDALRQMMARQQKTEDRKPVRLTTASGRGLQPGVDLDDSAALLALIEESSDSA